jgi:hypothetical protein
MDNLTYEAFIRRAWNCERFQHGANAGTWENLCEDKYNFNHAIGDKNVKKTKLKYERSFTKIKDYVDKAFNKILEKCASLGTSKVDKFLDLKKQANSSDSPSSLYDILRQSLDLLNDLKL